MTQEKCPAGIACGGVKYLLIGFVFFSIGVAAYKAASAPADPQAAAAPVVAEAAMAPAKTSEPALKVSAAKTALVYYFYTNTRCSSCKTIEAYTRAAVEKDFASDYKGWKVAFNGVNIDEAPGKHFIQDYRLNSKSVVVQKFSGDKTLNWVKLEKVWQLLDDKEAFMTYVTGETHNLLDGK